MIGDNKYLIIRRILESAGGTPLPGDLETDLLEKYLIIIGGTPVPGDDFNTLLREIVIAKGGTPTPGDQEWNLLVKWVQAEGDCRGCGDMVIDLWRRIFFLNNVTPPIPNGLLNGLTAYWNLDESSGTRVDSHASYDLLQTGSVSSEVAMLNNGAALFASSLDFLANTSSDLGTHSGSFSFSSWIKVVNTSAEGPVFGKGEILGDGWWQCRVVTGPFFALSSSDLDFNEERCISSVPIVAGVFYHVAVRYDASDGVAAIWVNGVKTEDLHLPAVDTVQAFIMSKDTVVVVDELAIWIGRAITDENASALYNGGIPLPYESFNLI